MAKKKRFFKFGLLPAHWGLSGKTRELAKAEYELEGEDLERKRIEINIAEKSDEEVQLDGFRLDLKYNKITEEDFERKKIALTVDDEKQKDLALLKVDKKYGHITDAEFEKKKASLLEEPFVQVAKVYTDPKDPAFGSVMLDWNQSFVNHLEDHGYGPHPNDEDTVNEWFNELCKNVALDAFDGLGDFSERVGPPVNRRTSVSDDVIFRGEQGSESENKEEDS